MRIQFCERMQQLRKEKGLKQLELANILNTTQRRISYMEKGVVEPDLATLISIASYFEVSTDYLLGIKDY